MREKGTERMEIHARRGPIIFLGLLVLTTTSGHPRAQDAGGGEAYPDNLDVKPRRVLGLDGEDGFHALKSTSSLIFCILDPELEKSAKESRCFNFNCKERAPGENEGEEKKQEGMEKTCLAKCLEFKGVIESDTAGDSPPEKSEPAPLVAGLKRTFDRFLPLITDNKYYQAKSLQDLLMQKQARLSGDVPLISVRFAFWRERPSGQHKKDEGNARLCARLGVRLFKLKVVNEKAPYNLTDVELLWQDSATGKVPLASFADTVEGRASAIRAAVIAALRDRISVNLCLNPRLGGEDVTKRGTSVFLGKSIAPRPEPEVED